MYRQSIAATCTITRVLQVSSCIVENLIRSPTSFTLLVMSNHLLLYLHLYRTNNKMPRASSYAHIDRHVRRSWCRAYSGRANEPLMNAEEGFSTQTDLFQLRPIYYSSFFILHHATPKKRRTFLYLLFCCIEHIKCNHYLTTRAFTTKSASSSA